MYRFVCRKQLEITQFYATSINCHDKRVTLHYDKQINIRKCIGLWQKTTRNCQQIPLIIQYLQRGNC